MSRCSNKVSEGRLTSHINVSNVCHCQVVKRIVILGVPGMINILKYYSEVFNIIFQSFWRTLEIFFPYTLRLCGSWELTKLCSMFVTRDASCRLSRQQ